MADQRRGMTDLELEQEIQAIHRKRAALNEEARWYCEEVDRRVALEQYARAYAEGDETRRAEVLEVLAPGDHEDVIGRSEKWAAHSQGPEIELPAPPARPRAWWRGG